MSFSVNTILTYKNPIDDSSYLALDNSILQIGGRIRNETSILIKELIFDNDFKPKTKKFNDVSVLTKALSKPGTFIFNDRIYLVGGLDKNNESTDHVYYIDKQDLPTGNWIRGYNNFPERTYNVSFVNINNRIYAIGNGLTINDKGSNKIYRAIFKDDKILEWKLVIELPLYFSNTKLLCLNNNIIILSKSVNNQPNSLIYAIKLDNKDTNKSHFVRMTDTFKFSMSATVIDNRDLITIGGFYITRNKDIMFDNKVSKLILISNNEYALSNIDNTTYFENIISDVRIGSNWFILSNSNGKMELAHIDLDHLKI